MKLKELKAKLWFNIFIRIAAIFVVFVLILSISNISFLVSFFSIKEKALLKEQTLEISKLDFENKSEITAKLADVNEKYNFDVEIYYEDGKILYTTHGSQLMDFFSLKNDRFNMSHDKMDIIKSQNLKDDVVFQEAVRRFDKNEYLLCYKKVTDDIYAEVRIQKQLISNSADIANEFIIIISVICFIISIIWVFVFARQFSQPISKMNEITKDMAKLNFERKLKINRTDEIGQLASSVNELSDSLSTALKELETKNATLKNEIEIERQLDVMRRGFVANVSHELKTPISIISGYAEGLKLNVNSDSKEEYCNTIIDESHRMNKLVLSILELSKYESGQIPLNIQDFDVSIMCSDLLKRIFKGKNINIENKIDENTFISADPILIEQVLKSYLENALSHVDKNGKVYIDCHRINNNIRINVYNTGSHIDENIMPQIWQSFFRGDTSHKRQSSRFGLGLSIVTAIMKMHNHGCGVYNTESGVCFWFEVEKAKANNNNL